MSTAPKDPALTPDRIPTPGHVPAPGVSAVQGLPPGRIAAGGWLLIALRLSFILLVVLAGLLLHLILRPLEWLALRHRRPVTSAVTQLVCTGLLLAIGLRFSMRGTPMRKAGAVVANHAGWLDILALNARARVYFVSKAEVASWPGIGFLARLTGTVFIARRGSEAKKQQALFEQRLRLGHRLLFFPEGTSTDSLRVLPFKSSLFEAFYSQGLERVLHIQPATVVWHAPAGADPRFYGWWGDMEFGTHLLQVLSKLRQGRVEVIWHPEVPVDAFAHRKELALYCERVIRTAHPLAEN